MSHRNGYLSFDVGEIYKHITCWMLMLAFQNEKQISQTIDKQRAYLQMK